MEGALGKQFLRAISSPLLNLGHDFRVHVLRKARVTEVRSW